MEMLRAEGKTKSIGVSNYRILDLEETLREAEVSRSLDFPDAFFIQIGLVGRSGSQSGTPLSCRVTGHREE